MADFLLYHEIENPPEKTTAELSNVVRLAHALEHVETQLAAPGVARNPETNNSFRAGKMESQYRTMPHEKKDLPPSWIETKVEPTTSEQANADEAAQNQAAQSKTAKPKVKKYIVRCKYHTDDAIAYRVYAQNKEDAEEIARLKFKEGDNQGRLLDTVKAVEVVNT
jgi:hypothetical protein